MLINQLQRHYLWIFIFLSGLSGLALGNLGATALGLFVGPATTKVQESPAMVPEASVTLPLASYNPILNRDIFNPAGNNQKFSLVESARQVTEKTSNAPSKWILIGTISGGHEPLATLGGATDTASYRLQQELPDGALVSVIERNRVELRYPDGRRQVLEITPDGISTSVAQSVPRGESGSTDQLVEDLGENQFQIPSSVAENARANLGDLLKQAQAVPYLEGNQTTGFQILMIQPGSLIAQLGLQKGDILREINGVALNSPEKALQVFGQVRQATQISIGLERRGKAMTFAYEIR
jgi:general secretion pathway protein C